jgi:hypothetical protein
MLALTAALALAAPPSARASAEGPATPQAVAAHAEFLAHTPAPPGGAAGVCVIDSGVDTNTDLGPALVKRSAFDGGTPDDLGAKSDQSTPLPKHGTYVAGIIASQIDGIGTNGIWPAARVLSYRVFAGPLTATTAAEYIRAIQWCINDPADHVRVINLSLSGLTATLAERASLEDKIAQVRRAPYFVNVVAAAGNGGLSQVAYPASSTNVLAVGATDEAGTLTPFSNRGAGLDISTLGSGTCVTTGHGTRLATAHGSSYAAPVVSAVLAALRSYRPELSPDQAEQLVMDRGRVTAAGTVLDASAAFEAAGLIDLVSAYGIGPSASCETATASAENPSVGGSEVRVEVATDQTERPDSSSERATDGDAPAPIVAPAHAAPPRPGNSRPIRPTLRAITFRHQVLSVRVGGLREGEQAIFRVGKRRLARTTGELQVRVAAWTEIRVQFVVPGVAKSDVLVVRHAREF